MAGKLRGWVLASLVLGVAATTQVASASMFTRTLGIDGVPSFDEHAGKSWLDQIQGANRLPKGMYEPPKGMLAPYASAQLGPEIAYTIVNYDASFIKAPEGQSLCQSIVDRLLAAWPGPKRSVRVLIVDAPAYGAYSNETGDIMVNIGTFNASPDKGVQSEDELALMLAHELSHMFLPHLQNKGTLSSITDTMNFAAISYASVAAVKNSRIEGKQLKLQGDNTLATQALIGGMASKMLVGDMFAPSWGRSDEREADRLGLDLARRAGYAIEEDEIMQFVGKHADEEAVRTERMARMEQLSDLMLLSAKVQAKSDNSQASNFASLLVKLIGQQAIAKGFNYLAELTTSHPNKADRQKDLIDYFHNAYPDAGEGKVVKRRNAEVKKVASLPSIKQTLKSMQETQRVRDELAKRGAAATEAAQKTSTKPVIDVPSACTPAAKAISANVAFPVDTAPRSWQIRGNWQSLTNDCRPHAPQDWQRSAQSNYASMEVLQNLAVGYSHTPNAKLLPGLYSRFKTLIGTDEPFPALAVAAALAQNNQVLAEQKAAQCYTYKQHAQYLVCTDLLGYNPLDKNVGAKTPEGKKAFADAAAKGAVDDVFTRPIEGFFK